MVSMNFVTKIFLAFVVLKGLIESYLDARNKNHIAAHQSKVPEEFADQISLEDHQKAASYSMAKIKAGQFFHFYDLLILLGWTIGGGVQLLNLQVVSLDKGPVISGLIFFASFGIISMILDLPQRIYTTFILEQKFGFNRTTLKVFITDMIKGLIVGAIVGLPILSVILLFMNEVEMWWIYAWAFLTIVQFVLLWAYPAFIAPLFNKFSPLEEGEVKQRVIQLLERTGFTSKGLFVMDASKRSSHGNAYFTGFGKNKRIVFFDTLIKSLNAGEVEAVLAHELGHFKLKHVMKGLVKSTIISFLGFALLGFLVDWQPFYTGHGVEVMNNYVALALFSMVSGVYTFFLTPIFAYSSRKHEFEADEFASKYANPINLIKALVKLYKDNASTLTPDPVYSKWYHSHPPALIRVKHLENLAESKG